jgi:DNA-directed RNA polymerase subunit RPC12/RpoP
MKMSHWRDFFCEDCKKEFTSSGQVRTPDICGHCYNHRWLKARQKPEPEAQHENSSRSRNTHL